MPKIFVPEFDYKPNYIVGIDVGTTTGLAIYKAIGTTKQLVNAYTTTIIDAFSIIHDLRLNGRIGIIIEDTRNLPIYRRNRNAKDGYALTARKNRGVGYVDAHTSIWIQFCEHYDIPYTTITPTTKKWNQTTFELTTRYHHKVSQHARDAARNVHLHNAEIHPFNVRIK